ncbi:MAG: acyl carrier protein [Sphingobacteriales bacterium]|nr:MAG: acyl carrier protein [Sphingobacteriales bacterium]
MDLNHFLQKFSEQFDLTDASQILPETEFKQLEEWSSMHALLVIALIDEEFDVPFSGEDLQNCVTVSDIYRTILDRITLSSK